MLSAPTRWARALSRTSRELVTRAVWVDGPLAGTDLRLRCLFVGSLTTIRSLQRRVYEGGGLILRRRRILVRALPAVLERSEPSFDLCVAVLPRRHDDAFRGLCDFRGQQRVRQVVDVPATWDELKAKLHRNARDTARLVRKAGLTCRLSRDLADLRFFYDRMFVPHTRQRYGEAAEIEPFETMPPFLAKGFLLFVEEAGRPIAGSLCLMDDQVLTYRRMGVLDADPAHSRKGAQMAVYHFSLQLAIERGIRKFDLMNSDAFLNDGVYQHKRKWGAATGPDEEARGWVYFFHRGTPARLAAFYRRHPVVVVTPGGLKGVVGLEDGQSLSPALTEELTERYRAPGLAGLMVLTSRSESPEEIAFSPA